MNLDPKPSPSETAVTYPEPDVLTVPTVPADAGRGVDVLVGTAMPAGVLTAPWTAAVTPDKEGFPLRRAWIAKLAHEPHSPVH